MALLLDHLGLDAPAQPGAGGEGRTGGDAGVPLQLPITLIDEDPDQPRTEFDAEALQELAQTIAARGVRQPVSVRPHPEVPGRWMLNFGARRLRASRLAGRAEIPAFVDATADSYDQVIENEQREGLKPMELALFVKRELAAGLSQAEIARRLGKTRGYLTFVCALIDPPDWLLDLYRSGRCRGISELYELRKLHAEHPAEVEQWLARQAHVARGDVQACKQGLQLAKAMPAKPSSGAPSNGAGLIPGERPAADVPLKTNPTPVAPGLALSVDTAATPQAQRKRWVLRGECGGVSVQLLLDRAPPTAGWVAVVREGDAQPSALRVADINGLRLAMP